MFKTIVRFLARKGGDETPAVPEVLARETYRGFELRAAPIREQAIWRVAGAVADMGTEPERVHAFIRADTCAGQDDAVALSLRKARQIVDEQGDMLFAE